MNRAHARVCERATLVRVEAPTFIGAPGTVTRGNGSRSTVDVIVQVAGIPAGGLVVGAIRDLDGAPVLLGPFDTLMLQPIDDLT